MVRIDPAQRFTCSQCGRCCHRSEVAVTQAEVDLYRRRNAARWFREDVGPEGTDRDPFEPFPQWPGLFRIRKRSDGACGFLSETSHCRLHEELGADRKPRTCRMFPFSFHAAPEGVVAVASFACPTIVANQGKPVAADALEPLRKEWGGTRSTPARELVKGRTIDARTSRVLRDNLLAMLMRASDDLRENIARMAASLDDLTRSRVLALGDDEFAEYAELTLRHAASRPDPIVRRPPGAIGRMMQYGFLYLVCATRQAVDSPSRSRAQLRWARIRLLAHFHGLAPPVGRVDVKAIRRHPIDINAEDIRPVVLHYLRSHLATLGAHHRPLIDDLAIAVSCLNAAIAMAKMSADVAGGRVDRPALIAAVTEAATLSHASGSAVVHWAANRFSAGTESLWTLAS